MKDCVGNWRMNEQIADRWEDQQYLHYNERRRENLIRGQSTPNKNLNAPLGQTAKIHKAHLRSKKTEVASYE